ncbi:MAG: surface lipoprotein assembly modifier [Albidovulum sp.]|nr:surface lipoprotein assembly modifier [Albidovulum sp.]
MNRIAASLAIALAIAIQIVVASIPAGAQSQRQVLTYEQAVGFARFLTRNGHYLDALLLLRQLPLDSDDRYEVLFLRGLAAMELSNLASDEEVRVGLLDEAVEALYLVVSNNPGLLRPRLELARAYFFQGNDEAAKEHFEWVLSTQPPPAVIYNVQVFLAQIRSRRRLTGYFGFALAPDTNITNVYEDRQVMILGLPFTLDEPAQAKTGIGLSLWGGGEYRLPIVPNKLSLRLGASSSITDYPGGANDNASLGVFAGPHYQFDNRTEASVVGFLTQRWSGGKEANWDLGARLSFARQVSERQRVSGEIGAYNRSHAYEPESDGRRHYVNVGSAFRIYDNTLLSLKYSRFFNDAERVKDRNNGYSLGAEIAFALQGGYDLSFGADYTSTKIEGNWFPFIVDGSMRTDNLRSYSVGIGNRNFRLFGFSPKLSLTAFHKTSNVQTAGFKKRRVEVSFVRYY